MSSAVGTNPRRSFTGLGVFAGRVLPAAMPLRINSAIASFSFFRSCTARILTSRMRSSGRSRVVFIGSQIARKLVFCQRAQAFNFWNLAVAPLQLGEDVVDLYCFPPT